MDQQEKITLEELGFQPWDTGGGCESMRKELDDSGYVLLTDPEDPALPNPNGPFLIGRYNENEKQIESLIIPTLNELQNYLNHTK